MEETGEGCLLARRGLVGCGQGRTSPAYRRHSCLPLRGLSSPPEARMIPASLSFAAFGRLESRRYGFGTARRLPSEVPLSPAACQAQPCLRTRCGWAPRAPPTTVAGRWPLHVSLFTFQPFTSFLRSRAVGAREGGWTPPLPTPSGCTGTCFFYAAVDNPVRAWLILTASLTEFLDP
jgi:hypothetical protein